MSLVLNVEILGEFKKLTEATTGSQKSLGNLENSAKKISSGINKTLGLIGVGFSLNFLVDQFKESTKAAIEDQKSKVLLNKALEDNLGLTKQQTTQVDKYITKLQLQTSITDDQLRPALSKLSLAAKSSTEGMRLLSIATDVAAGTGKNLDTVSQAMARALAGNTTALGRLVPSVKNAQDPSAELEKLFDGAAEAAANTDPYAKLNIIFGEMQEQIGEALLPVLADFSNWLSTPEGQAKMQAIVDGIVEIVRWFGELADWIDRYVVPALERLTGEKGFGAIINAATVLISALGFLKVAMIFLTAGNPVLAGIVAGIGLIAAGMIAVFNNTKAATSAFEEFTRQQNLARVTQTPSTPEQIAGETYQGILNPPGQVPRSTAPVPGKPGATRIEVNINRAQINANDVVKVINDKLKSQGSTVRLQ